MTAWDNAGRGIRSPSQKTSLANKTGTYPNMVCEKSSDRPYDAYSQAESHGAARGPSQCVTKGDMIFHCQEV